MVIDCVTYNGERELFDLRYNVLKDYVDEFIVVEAPTTFSGLPKPLYFKDIKSKYKNVKYHVIDENYSAEEITQAENSPNTQGAEHWKREFLQKESIKKSLVHLNNTDTVYVGDVDEIWERKAILTPLKLKLRVYTYYLNNASSEEFWGTLVSPYEIIKYSCLNHLRTLAPKSKEYLGWHFTSMGGADKLRQKLTDSYTQDSYATPAVLENIGYNIESGRDFLGRDFTYHIDEAHWPHYLKSHKEKYAHLCK